MADLFEQVLHHIEGSEREIQNWQTLDGIKTVEFQSFGPDRWIESVHENGRLMAIDCLALILFTVGKSFDREQERRIVESWALELRKAVSTGEIQARDPVTLLALETLPDGWEWLISMADADRFIAARGLDWRFAEIASHLFTECKQSIQNRRFPPWTRTAPASAPTATPAPVAASIQCAPEQSLPTKDISECFDGLNGWNAETWPKRLSGANWPKPALVALGAAGGATSLWNPLKLAQLVCGRTKGQRPKEQILKSFKSRFDTNPVLAPWKSAFNEYFAMFSETD